MASPSERMRKFSFGSMIFWICNLIAVVTLYFVLDKATFESFCLFYLAIVSVWALVQESFNGWVEGKVAVKQDEQDEA